MSRTKIIGGAGFLVLITAMVSVCFLVGLDSCSVASAQKSEIKTPERAANEKDKKAKTKKSNTRELVDIATNKRDMAEQAYRELLTASAQIETLIRQSTYKVPSGTSESDHFTGKIIWPISGEITSEFGWKTHPIFVATMKYHNGLDIAGEYGLPVVAAAGGVVIYAGWISGYGNTVIIDHDGKISTVYAHNDNLKVFEGQSVSQGQLIADCGSTGYSTGPHVHFEVRESGSPVSPYNYL